MPFMAIMTVAATASANSSNDSSNNINERDIEAVKNLVRSKRAIYLADKTSHLALSGDVRFEYRHVTQKTKSYSEEGGWQKLRGGNSGECMSFGTNEFGVEFNLYLDYTTDRTWAGVHLEFDNEAGSTSDCGCEGNCGSGACDALCLREAYFGYNIFEDGESRLDIEMGRRDMYHLFDSRVQFQNRFDGVWMTYSNSFKDITDFYVRGGAFVIDSVVDNYGWAAELGFTDIMNVGLDIKYSLVDYSRGTDRCGQNANDNSECVWSWHFLNSQLSAAYHFDPEMIGVDMTLYGAVIYNHLARRLEIEGESHRGRWAWYLGMMFGGGVKAEGDWSVDANLQYVGAQSVPTFGVSGVGKGNLVGGCAVLPGEEGSIVDGQANYYGFAVEGAYAITDNITVEGEIEYSNLLEDWGTNAGNRYRKYEVKFIYAF